MSTGELSGTDSEPQQQPDPSAQPLDLRLLPAALVAWAAALTAVYSAAEVSLRLGVVLGGVGLASATALWLLPRASSARLWGTALQTALCLVIGACVMVSAGWSQHRQESTGWDQAVDSAVPAEVTLRVSADSQPLGGPAPGNDETAGTRTPAVVTHARFGAAQRSQRIGAEVVLIEREGGSQEWVAGQRYRLTANLSPTRAADQAAAVVTPFGDSEPQLLDHDSWTQLTGLFNSVRSATAEAAGVAVGAGPALLPGVVLGDRSQQSPELTESMRISGLSHMTVVSGTHTSLVMGALLGLLRLSRAPRWMIPPVLIAGLVLYVLLVQPAPSVIRAAVMGSIGALAVFAGRGRASSALLCGCVILLLLYNPWYASNAAFQLSVAATAGIVAVGHRLKRLFDRWMPGVLAGPLALAASAQLFVTPVLLPIAEGITLYSIPANIMAGPLLPFAAVPGTLAAVLIPALPWASTALLWLAGLPAAGIAIIGTWVSELPQALAPWPDGWQGWVLAGVYVAAAILLCWPIVEARPPRRAEWGVLGVAAGMLVAVVAPVGGLFAAGPPEQWRFALCDVGQGDMLVVRTAERSAIVVDAGEQPHPAQQCLQRLDVETVEVLMITHEHRDHYGGSPGIADAAQVEQIVYSSTAGWTPGEALAELDADFSDVAARRGQVGENQVYDTTYPAAWSLWAAADYHENPNDNSLVTLFEVWDEKGPADAAGSANDPLRLLALGDLEEEIAAILLHAESLPRHVDVLKVAHHGAANGGTQILQALQPPIALIGVGEDNTYGHPDPGIIDALGEWGSAVYRTDLHGTVVFSLSAGELEAETLD